MAPTNENNKIWTTSNLILTGLGSLILLLLAGGFWSINNKIETGDRVIGERITGLSVQLSSTTDRLQRFCDDVTRIDTHQKIRLERETREKKP